jgi:hypothetical protein
MPNVNFYDLETKRWSIPISAGAILDDGDHWFELGPQCIEKLASLMLKKRGTWIAHYGGGFDHLLVLPFLGPIKKAILTGSRLLSVELWSGITLLDSFPGWLCSLKAIGDFVGMPKLDYNRTRLSELSLNELEAYNMRDNEILKAGWELADSVSQSLGMARKKTAGSAANEALKKLEPDTWASFQRNAIHHQEMFSATGIARGGRTEIFACGKVEGVYCYDIKSSYPFRYFHPEGLGAGIQPCENPIREWHNPHAILLVSWDRHVDGADSIAPVLSMTGKGVGRNLTAWVCHDERLLMSEDRYTTINGAKAGFKPMVVLKDAGKTFARELFAFKERGIPFVKVWLNSLHGKFNESFIKDSWEGRYPYEAFMKRPREYANGLWRFNSLDVDDSGYCKPNIQPINAALIFGRARAHITRMLRDLQNAGFRIYYSDTDSIFTSANPDEVRATIRAGEYGTELGQLAPEGGPFSGYILG